MDHTQETTPGRIYRYRRNTPHTVWGSTSYQPHDRRTSFSSCRFRRLFSSILPLPMVGAAPQRIFPCVLACNHSAFLEGGTRVHSETSTCFPQTATMVVPTMPEINQASRLSSSAAGGKQDTTRLAKTHLFEGSPRSKHPNQPTHKKNRKENTPAGLINSTTFSSSAQAENAKKRIKIQATPPPTRRKRCFGSA